MKWRADRYGIGWYCGELRGGVRAAVAACPRSRVLLSPRRTIPPNLAELEINSALRNNRTIVADNIEAALAAGDADLANSFVELARDEEHRARRRLVAAA